MFKRIVASVVLATMIISNVPALNVSAIENVNQNTDLQEETTEDSQQENTLKTNEQEQDESDEITEIEENSEENTQVEKDDANKEISTYSENSDIRTYATSSELFLTATVSEKTYTAFENSNGQYFLYLPIKTTLNGLVLKYNINLTSVDGGTIDTDNKTITLNGQEDVTLSGPSGTFHLKVATSNLDSMSISLNGTTLNQINSGKKTERYQGNTLNISSNDYNDFNDTIELKGRGNASWKFPKRGYQIKLSDKKSLLGMNKAKTWVLIANYGDASLARNKLTQELAKDMGCIYYSNSKYIDLWIDGEYLGIYTLCEKVQVAKNRVDLKNNDGLLVEMDNNYYEDEDYYFQSDYSKGHFVLKDSKADDAGSTNSVTKSSFNQFKTYLNNFEKELYAKNKDWNKISKMIDVDSFIKYYFLNEFTENADGCRSSMFMYQDGKNDVIHLGPVWDFDLALGNCFSEAYGGLTNVDYMMNANKYSEHSIDWFHQLFKIPEFKKRAREIYTQSIQKVLNEKDSIINDCYNSLTKSAYYNFNKWKILGKENAFESYRGHVYLNSFKEEVDYMKTWSTNRLNYLNTKVFDK